MDWCIGIKVIHDANAFIILNVYTPYECYKNEDEYLNRLGVISYFINDNSHTCIYVLADISDSNSLFGQHLLQFCRDNKVILSSKVWLPANSLLHLYQ